MKTRMKHYLLIDCSYVFFQFVIMGTFDLLTNHAYDFWEYVTNSLGIIGISIIFYFSAEMYKKYKQQKS
ncbi:hypothetical protein [Fructobacillus ficulneus]|uniref:Uncharacterized protein n=1 Tax=Fructobacillus ficulneus TaxID=157463 RepID=A0A0K8MG74_9LACO|nr:hypothetical protein [Fructobacillus ficulneus]GAO99452.1 hypothetical protein FFIC_140460 [Fructobacillus ficulneus]